MDLVLAGQCACWDGEGIGDPIQPESSGHAVEHAPEMRCGQIGSHKSPVEATAECDVPGFMQPFSRWLARLANCGMWPPCTHPIER